MQPMQPSPPFIVVMGLSYMTSIARVTVFWIEWCFHLFLWRPLIPSVISSPVLGLE